MRYGPIVIKDVKHSYIKMCKTSVTQKRPLGFCHAEATTQNIMALKLLQDEPVELQYSPTKIIREELLMKAVSKAKVDQSSRTLVGYSLALKFEWWC